MKVWAETENSATTAALDSIWFELKTNVHVVRALNYGFVNNPDMMQAHTFFDSYQIETFSSKCVATYLAGENPHTHHSIHISIRGIKYCRFACDKTHRLDLFGLEFWCTLTTITITYDYRSVFIWFCEYASIRRNAELKSNQNNAHINDMLHQGLTYRNMFASDWLDCNTF